MKKYKDALDLVNISRRFEKKNAVDNLNLMLSSGQVTCLLGPSGCGKSTTLRIAAGVEKQDKGEVHISGELISDGKRQHLPPELRSVGLMFQDFALFPHLTILQNVIFGIKSHGSKEDIFYRGMNLLERVGLSNICEKYPHTLSGGEQQRVALVRAIAPKPKVLLMDEPFSGLDNRLRDDIRDQTLSLLKEEQTAVLLVTHEPAEAMRMADTIALMHDGVILQEGAPYNIYNKPVDARVASFFSDVNIIRGVVKQSRIDTSFGWFITPGIEEGTSVQILIRPQHLKIDFDRKGKGPFPTSEDGVPARGFVARARFVGNESLIELRMSADSSILKATVPGVFLPSKDTPLWLSMRRDRCFVFKI
ncbi:MAG: ABC transporter ATP-binding protein [Paracoccaceae bacterium]|nr:ABC transporter ATP-binding protein [Paracoccaceae bacterium]